MKHHSLIASVVDILSGSVVDSDPHQEIYLDYPYDGGVVLPVMRFQWLVKYVGPAVPHGQ